MLRFRFKVSDRPAHVTEMELFDSDQLVRITEVEAFSAQLSQMIMGIQHAPGVKTLEEMTQERGSSILPDPPDSYFSFSRILQQTLDGLYLPTGFSKELVEGFAKLSVSDLFLEYANLLPIHWGFCMESRAIFKFGIDTSLPLWPLIAPLYGFKGDAPVNEQIEIDSLVAYYQSVDPEETRSLETDKVIAQACTRPPNQAFPSDSTHLIEDLLALPKLHLSRPLFPFDLHPSVDRLIAEPLIKENEALYNQAKWEILLKIILLPHTLFDAVGKLFIPSHPDLRHACVQHLRERQAAFQVVLLESEEFKQFIFQNGYFALEKILREIDQFNQSLAPERRSMSIPSEPLTTAFMEIFKSIEPAATQMEHCKMLAALEILKKVTQKQYDWRINKRKKPGRKASLFQNLLLGLANLELLFCSFPREKQIEYLQTTVNYLEILSSHKTNRVMRFFSKKSPSTQTFWEEFQHQYGNFLEHEIGLAFPFRDFSDDEKLRYYRAYEQAFLKTKRQMLGRDDPAFSHRASVMLSPPPIPGSPRKTGSNR